MVQLVVSEGLWKPISLSKEGPKISHLCFVSIIERIAQIFGKVFEMHILWFPRICVGISVMAIFILDGFLASTP